MESSFQAFGISVAVHRTKRQRLKPLQFFITYGTAEAVPYNDSPLTSQAP
jgi:hypothetical protein